MSWTPPPLLITVLDDQCLPLAQQLAQKINLPLQLPNDRTDTTQCDKTWQLQTGEHTLRVVRPDGLAMSVDFINSKAQRRSNENDILQQPLSKALGIKTFQKRNERLPTVVDGTAGLGQDAWLIARLGCKITLIEQSPVLGALLDFALQQALKHPEYESTAQLLSIKNTNAAQYLIDHTDIGADIVYLDPMYPARRKQALVKKEMQLLHDLVGPDNNGPDLLTNALKHARYRVIVKRPKGAATLTGTDEWSGQLTSVSSPNTRFDIYHTER